MKLRLFLIVSISLLASIAKAEMYKWVDEHGQAHYSDTYSGASDSNEVNYAPDTINTAVPFDSSDFVDTTVRIYTTRSCGICRAAKTYLRKRSVPYIEYDIEQNNAALTEFRRLKGRGVPLMTIGSQVITGFNRQRVDQALSKIGY